MTSSTDASAEFRDGIPSDPEDPTISPASETDKPAPQGRIGAFQSRNFRLLWTGLVIANSGSWMATTAEGWLVTELEPDNAALYVGMISLAFALPMLC